MSGENGTNGSPGKKPGKTVPEKDPETGHFLPGNCGGPGRPKGSIDFMAVCRQRAKEANISLEDLIWAVARGVIAKASNGDAACAKIILDRTCGIVEKAPDVNVAVDARTAVVNGEGNGKGPPVPKRADLGAYIKRLGEVAEQQGLIREPSPAAIARKAADDLEIDELLS